MPSPTMECVNHDTQLSRYFRIMGSPLKLKIIRMLGERPMSVTQIIELLNIGEERIGRTAVSSALQVLAKLDIVHHGLGRVHVYSLDKSTVRKVFRAGLALINE